MTQHWRMPGILVYSFFNSRIKKMTNISNCTKKRRQFVDLFDVDNVDCVIGGRE